MLIYVAYPDLLLVSLVWRADEKTGLEGLELIVSDSTSRPATRQLAEPGRTR